MVGTRGPPPSLLTSCLRAAALRAASTAACPRGEPRRCFVPKTKWGVQGESEQPVVLDSGPARLTFGFAYSAQGPHRIELVQAIPGTLWEVPRPGGAHHLGYWSDDVRPCPRRSPHAACRSPPGSEPASRTGAPALIVMHRAPSGLYVELVDRSLREMLFGQDLAMD